MKSTIEDVAKKVNVSIATVSRVINNSLKVTAKTRQKVLTAMDELGYQPYYRLAMKSIKVVGVLIPDIDNLYYSQVLKAMEKEFIKNHYNIFLCHTEENLEEEKMYLDTLLSKNVDGLIFFSARPKDYQTHYIEDISKKIPILMMNEYILGSNTYSVMSDMTEGAYLAASYLTSIGHKRIAFINGPTKYLSYRDKLSGFKNAIEENGLPIRDDYIISDIPYEDGGYRSAKKLISLKDKPTAILTASDQIAIGAMSAVQESGYSIPEDFSIIGYGNIPISSKIFPSLTTVDQYPEKIGLLSAKTMMKAIVQDEIESKKILVHPQLCIRNSCKVIDS